MSRTIMNEHLSEDELILHCYGEVDRDDRSRVDAHLAACAECQLATEKLARVMSGTLGTVAEPPLMHAAEVHA